MSKVTQKLEERLQQILDLQKQREEITARLAELTGLAISKNNAPQFLPQGVSLNEEIKKIFEERGGKLRILEVKKEVDQRHRVNIPRRNIQGAIQYMTKRKTLEKIPDEYGMYALKQKEEIETNT